MSSNDLVPPAKSAPAPARSAATPVMSAPVPAKPAAAEVEFARGVLSRGPSCRRGGEGKDAALLHLPCVQGQSSLCKLIGPSLPSRASSTTHRWWSVVSGLALDLPPLSAGAGELPGNEPGAAERAAEFEPGGMGPSGHLLLC